MARSTQELFNTFLRPFLSSFGTVILECSDGWCVSSCTQAVSQHCVVPALWSCYSFHQSILLMLWLIGVCLCVKSESTKEPLTEMKRRERCRCQILTPLTLTAACWMLFSQPLITDLADFPSFQTLKLLARGQDIKKCHCQFRLKLQFDLRRWKHFSTSVCQYEQNIMLNWVAAAFANEAYVRFYNQVFRSRFGE